VQAATVLLAEISAAERKLFNMNSRVLLLIAGLLLGGLVGGSHARPRQK
jgi:hypothetical protein